MDKMKAIFKRCNIQKYLPFFTVIFLIVCLSACGLNEQSDRMAEPYNEQSDEPFIEESDHVPEPMVGAPAPPTPQFIGHVEVYRLHDGWFYYRYLDNSETNHEIVLYRMRTDGTGKAELLRLDADNYIDMGTRGWWLYFDFDNDWISFLNFADGDAPYKMRTDGTEKTKLNNDEVSGALDIRTDKWIVGENDDWIYFHEFNNDDLYLYKMRTDGTETTAVAGGLSALKITDDWIYFENQSDIDGYSLYRMRIDGTDKIQLDDYRIYDYSQVFFSDGRIYYLIFMEGRPIRSLNEDGTEKAYLQLDDLGYIIAVDDGWIYYQSNHAQFFEGDVHSWYEVQGNIYMVRTDGSEKTEIIF